MDIIGIGLMRRSMQESHPIATPPFLGVVGKQPGAYDWGANPVFFVHYSRVTNVQILP